MLRLGPLNFNEPSLNWNDVARKAARLEFTVNSNEEGLVRAEFFAAADYNKMKPRLTLHESGWSPDRNDPDWREIRPLNKQ
jgi:hypothetical protein